MPGLLASYLSAVPNQAGGAGQGDWQPPPCSAGREHS